MFEYKIVSSRIGLCELDLNKFGEDDWSLTTILQGTEQYEISYNEYKDVPCLYYYFQRKKERS